MQREYLIMKRSGDELIPVTALSASCAEEAREALHWLAVHHPERAELHLGPGEFYEILEEEHCPAEEWRTAREALKKMDRPKPA